MKRILPALSLLTRVTLVLALVALFTSEAVEATDWYFGGGCSDVVSCYVLTMNQVWGVLAPDPAPPTPINFMTGTGGGFTNCVSGTSTSGCPTGDAQFSINNGTIETTDLKFTSPTLNLTTGCSGTNCLNANVTVTQQNGSVTSGSGWPQYNGCWKQCTIASITDATHGVCNTPTSSAGTCSGSGGLNGTTGADPNTNATIVVWDGKDQTAFANAITAAANLSTSFNTGGLLQVPCGTYVIGAANMTTNTLPARITIQGQAASCVTFINPFFTGSSIILAMNNGDRVEGITFAGTDTNAHADGFTRRTSDDLIVMNPNNGVGNAPIASAVVGNVFEYVWSDQGGIAINAGLGFASGSPPCAYGAYPNSSNVCTAEPTNNLIAYNYFHNCESWAMQLSGGTGNVIFGNKMLDCGPMNIENGSTQMSDAMISGNLIMGNDGRCDATGDGVYNDAVAVSLNRTPYDGCTVYSQDDGRSALHFGSDQFFGNHLHADTTGATAGFSCGGASHATTSGNKCTAGENCANGLNGVNC